MQHPIFQLALSVLIAFWTVRAALARGRSPWLWAGTSLTLGILSVAYDALTMLNLVSVAPLLYLMLFVQPRARRPVRPQRNNCPKCAAAHSPQQNFCTKCGWDLSREYAPESGDTVLASEMRQPSTPPERDAAAAAATMERPAETPSDAAPPEPASTAKPASTPEPAAQRPTDAAAPPPPPPSAPEPQPEPRPWGIPQPGPAPTAEQMTARGATLLSEGRIQEAIDQFTKAIALDPKHREAFEGRAEAYTQQGRGERAAEDYRRIQALNAGS